jgi:hypothetical protein
MFLMLYSPLDTALLLVLMQPSGDGYFWLCSSKSSFRGTLPRCTAGVAEPDLHFSHCLFLTYLRSAGPPPAAGSSTPPTLDGTAHTCSPSSMATCPSSLTRAALPDSVVIFLAVSLHQIHSYLTMISMSTCVTFLSSKPIL